MKTKFTFAAMLTLLFLAAAASAWSQSTTARIKGTITAGGKPLPDVQVVLTNKDNGRTFKFKADKNGQVTGFSVPYGDYDQEVFSTTGESLYKKPIRIVSENGSTENDISVEVSGGKTGQPTVSKEELERLKGEREKALGENALISQLNPALQAKDWATAEPILQKLITMNPARWDYQQALGNAQLSEGKFEEAVATFEKAIPIAENATKT